MTSVGRTRVVIALAVFSCASIGCSGETAGPTTGQPPPPGPPSPPGPTAYLLLSGVKFLPDRLSTAWQLNPAIAVQGTDLYFSDSSDTPLKRLAVNTGIVTPLARRFTVPLRVTVQGRRVLWSDGPRLLALSLDTGEETVLATGNLGVTPDLIADEASAYWVRTLSTSSCNPSCNFAIERVGPAGSVTLAEVQRPVVALAQDATTLYWVESSALKSVPKAGGSVTLLVDALLNGLPQPPPPAYLPGAWTPVGGLAVEGATLFFAETELSEHRLLTVSTAGGPVTHLGSVPRPNEFDLPTRPNRLRASGGSPVWMDASGVRSLDIASGTVVTLLDGLVGTADLVVAGAGFVVSDAGTLVGSAPATGAGRVQVVARIGGPASIASQGLDAPGPVATDGTTVYWGEIWRVGSAPLSGGRATTLASGIVSDIPQFGIAADALIVADGPLLKRVPLAGGSPERLTALFRATPAPYVPPPPSDLVLDDTSAWVAFPGGGVSRIPFDGSPPTDFAVPGFASPMDCPSRVVLAGDRVYWSSGPLHQPLGCAIASAPKGGGPVTVLTEGPGIINDFAVSAGELWFTTQPLVIVDGGGSRQVGIAGVNHMPATGGPVTSLNTPGGPVALALDDVRVYWVDLFGNVGIMRRPESAIQFVAIGSSRWDSTSYDRIITAGGGAVLTKMLYDALIFVAP